MLSLEPIHFGTDRKNPEFKLCVGYYSKELQTIDFIAGYEDVSYTLVNMTVSDKNHHEKPGIGCLSALPFDKKRCLLASGGFDNRIKITSLKTMKEIITLKFHQSIVNQVLLENADASQAHNSPQHVSSPFGVGSTEVDEFSKSGKALDMLAALN